MTTEAAAPRCPNCSREYIKRVHRQGLYERLASFFYIYPFRCQLCSHRFLFRQIGVRYTKIFFDRREYERMPSRFLSFIEWDKLNAEGTVVEISMAGCSIQTDAELAPGSIVKLQLNVFDDERSVLVDAAVVRSSYPKRLGVEFLSLDRREKDKLQFFVRGLLAHPQTLHPEVPLNKSGILEPEFRTSRNPRACEVLQMSGK
jgi:hypothetical protein